MPLAKQSLDISFAQGLDTKTDPWQTDPHTFLALENSVFTTGKRLTKRNGYRQLNSLPNTTSTYLTTLNGNLTALGKNIYARNNADASWIQRGETQPIEVSTLPLIRNNINQVQVDAAVAPNGLVCTVYTEINAGVTDYRYAIADSVTGQSIVAPSVIPVVSGTVSAPRVFLLGDNFIIAFTNLISSTNHLQYIAVSIFNPTNVTANVDIADNYIPASTVSWDALTVNNNLYFAYNTTSGGQAVVVTYISSALGSPVASHSFSGRTATMMSVSADIDTPSSPQIYIAFYDLSSATGYVASVDQNVNVIFAPVEVITSGTVLNITSAAHGGSARVFYEVSNNYSYDSAVPTHFVNGLSISTTGTIALTPYAVARSVGLASKAFIVDGIDYFLAVYQSPYQPTYFLINGTLSVANNPFTGVRVAAKLAYGNGGGYLTLGLPLVTVTDGNIAQVAYRFKDLISPAAKQTPVSTTAQVAGVYSQTGLNLGTFVIGTDNIDTAEIASTLNISGGFLWMYDGYIPVEQNFFLWPDSVEAAAQADPAVTGTVSNVTNPTVMTSVASVVGIGVGMKITGTNIPANTFVVAVGSTTVTMSNAATGAGTATYTFFGNQDTGGSPYYYQVTYEWTDNQGNAHRSAPSIPVSATTTSGHTSVVVNIPTLRLTYKIANPVKIVIYRWSTAQQVYYQITSLTSAILNDYSIDSITYVDAATDASILGNNIIYTTGGVVEDVNAPASNILTLFDDRLWLVDAEDPNLLWFSKQVIEATPVEMSDLLTLYVAPTQGAQGSTGPITAFAPMDDKLIIFKENAIYYVNGTGPNNTGAQNEYSQPIFITATVGCTNQRSLVFQPSGVMFQSNKGIWLLGRDLSTSYIGAPVEKFNDALVQSAVNVPETNQIRFTISTGQTLMFDYYYSQWGTFTGVPAISSCVYQGMHTFLNQFAAVYQESPGFYQDGSNPVLISFTMSWLSLAGIQGYQRAFWFYLLGQYLTPHKLQITIAYDFNPSPTQASLISPTNFSQVFGGPLVNPGDGTDSADPFGQGSPMGGEGDVEQWRVFLTKQRCQSIQLGLQEIYDPSFGVPAGQGLSLSGIKLTYAGKQSFRPMPSRQSIGGGTK